MRTSLSHRASPVHNIGNATALAAGEVGNPPQHYEMELALLVGYDRFRRIRARQNHEIRLLFLLYRR
jgi:hypothetical protein